MWNPDGMSMQPYQPNSIEVQKQQVRKDARTTAIALGVTVVALPIALFASSFFTVVAILAGIVAIYKGNQVRQAISGKPKKRELY
ncbi:xanthine/uracil permease [Dietzia sp. 2505]